MPLVTQDAAAFARAVEGSGRLLALDLGTKTIGLAVSDDAWQFASPTRTLRRTKFQQDMRELVQYADSERIVGFVLGLPVNMDGTQGPRAQSTRAFAFNAGRLDPRPFLLVDERLSSFEAADRLEIAGETGEVDHVAAAVILEEALQALRQASAG